MTGLKRVSDTFKDDRPTAIDKSHNNGCKIWINLIQDYIQVIGVPIYLLVNCYTLLFMIHI